MSTITTERSQVSVLREIETIGRSRKPTKRRKRIDGGDPVELAKRPELLLGRRVEPRAGDLVLVGEDQDDEPDPP